MRCGNGLMLAGLIVTLIGLGVAVSHTLHLPGYWSTVGVGVALLIAGALRAAGRGRRPDAGAS
jgi:hypothetical protein